MEDNVDLVSVDARNVTEHGFFCYRSKSNSEGYQRKLNWLSQRFAEGLHIKMLHENRKPVGFIEYIPGELAWRAVQAPGLMMIHCLWVVGRAKGKGYGSLLLQHCVRDARRLGMRGVAVVTSQGNWLAGNKIFLRNGFEPVDQAPPSFELLVKNFRAVPAPAFPTDWEARLGRYGPGLTVIRSDQCPYLPDGTIAALEAAQELDVESRVVELKSAQAVHELAPSAYGVFSIVYNGELVTYHYIGKKERRRLLDMHRNR